MKDLATLSAFIEERLDQLAFPQNPTNLYDPLRYFMTLGGKRMRPILTLMSAELFSVSRDESLPAALCIECFHNFSLIHDDIMDEAPVRRGQPTVHTRWNRDIAILSGDVLFVEAYRQLSHYADQRLPELLKRFNDTATEVCEGQQMDMDFERSDRVSEEAYLEMIRLKTSVLLGCALEFGAILGNADLSGRKLVYDFGVQLGLAFQVQDDLLDLYADPETFGKQVGGDVLANKKTLLLLTAKRLAEAANDRRVEGLLAMASTPKKVACARELFRELGATAAVQQTIDHYYNSAMNSLSALPVDDERKAPLRELADFLINRVQ